MKRLPFLAVAVSVVVLAACGGTNGEAPTQTPPVFNGATVTAYGGVPESQDSFELTVKGVEGGARTASLTPAGTYKASFVDLTGPYVLGNRNANGITFGNSYLVTLATGPGAVNITALTTLAVAQLFGADPTRFFEQLSTQGDPALLAINTVAMAAAQAEVKRYLLQQYAFTVPAAVGDFFTAPFVPQAGDPMFDAIVALNTRLAENGTDLYVVATQLGQNAAVCNVARIDLTLDGDTRDFCPARRSAQPDSGDASLVNYRFITTAGAVLTVVGRGSSVLSASLLQSTDISFACSGASCAGITLGPVSADSSRPLSFANVQLAGDSGTALFDGSLQSSKTVATPPVLPCADNNYFIVYPSAEVDGACASGAPIGVGGGVVDGAIRRIRDFFPDGSVTPTAARLEIRTEGEQIVSVLVPILDPVTATPTLLFKCRSPDCNGVTVGPARDDFDVIAPSIGRLRLITLDNTVLQALYPDGTPAPDGYAIVSGSLDSFEFIPEPATVLRPADCVPSQRLTATLGLDPPIDVCPPALPPEGFPIDQFLNTQRINETDLSVLLTSLYINEQGGFVYGDDGGVRLTISGDSVIDAQFVLQGTSNRFRCEGAGCAGIVVSAADETGQRIITATHAELQEIETAGLIGDRLLILDGSFVAPAPP